MSTTNILDLNNRIDALEKNSGGGGSADSAKRSDIATEFSTETNYTAGCFVYYEGKLYQFNADHSAGAWDPTDVVEANVTDQIVSNASAIAGLSASDVAYDNTDSGLTATDVQGAVDELSDSYPADKVLLSDGVTSVEDALDGLTANTIGTSVNLSDYNSASNRYTFPNDGYVYINAGGQTNSTALVNLADADTQTIGASYASSISIPYVTIFVKKGFKTFVTLTDGGIAYYRPLT